jgi:hypothetical protein
MGELLKQFDGKRSNQHSVVDKAVTLRTKSKRNAAASEVDDA